MIQADAGGGEWLLADGPRTDWDTRDRLCDLCDARDKENENKKEKRKRKRRLGGNTEID
jgi:hypothetical protein